MRDSMGNSAGRQHTLNSALEHGWNVLEEYGKAEAASRRQKRIERKHKDKEDWHERRKSRVY